MSSPAFQEATQAIDRGDVDHLRELLREHPELADERGDEEETLLIHLIDWPGHRPRAEDSARALLECGADVDARRNEQNGTSLAGTLCTIEPNTARVLLEFGADPRAELGWMEGTVESFADMLCENDTQAGRPDISAICELMSQALGRPVPRRPRIGGVTPLLFVKDFEAGRRYYIETLGFRVDWVDDSDADGYLCMSRGGAEFHLSQCHCPDQIHNGRLVARIGVPEIDRLASEFQERNVSFRREPKNQPWGLREFEVEDPDGNRLIFFGQPTPSDEEEPAEDQA